jgi:hypothetical protein
MHQPMSGAAPTRREYHRPDLPDDSRITWPQATPAPEAFPVPVTRRQLETPGKKSMSALATMRSLRIGKASIGRNHLSGQPVFQPLG